MGKYQKLRVASVLLLASLLLIAQGRAASLQQMLNRAWGGDLRDLRAAIQRGEVKPGDHDPNGVTPLMVLAWNEDIPGLRTQLEAGADINAADDRGNTALHMCVNDARLKALAFLIQHGANVNAQNKPRETPLNLACVKGNTEAAAMLLKAKADPDLAAQFGAPIHYAAGWGRSSLILQLLEAGVDVNARNPFDGDTPLISAAASGKLECVRLLLDRGADREATNTLGRSALLEALSNGKSAVAEALLNARCDWHKQDTENHGAIFFAANIPDPGLVRRLAELGANTNQIHIKELHLDAITDPQQRWAYAVTAIQVMEEHLDFRIISQTSRGGADRARIKNLLAAQWGIGSKADFSDVLTGVEEDELPAKFAELTKTILLLSAQEFMKQQEILLVSDPALRRRRQVAQQLLEKGEATTLDGWQAVRVIHLLQLARAAGFISPPEAWAQIRPKLQTLRANYSSWEELSRSICAGYAFEGRSEPRRPLLLERMLLNKSDAASPWNQLKWQKPKAKKS